MSRTTFIAGLALSAATAAGCTGGPVEHAWDTAGSLGGPGFGTFSCTFTVPDTPAYTQQALFLWCGVQQAVLYTPMGDASFGVLQPALMFGSSCIRALPEGSGIGPGSDPTYDANPYWYYSAMYVYPSSGASFGYQCTSGPVFKASPGDVLVSTITLAASGATVAIAAPDGTGNSTLSPASPWAKAGQSWSQFLGGGDQLIVEAAVETWNLTSPSEWPTALRAGWSVAASISPASGLTSAEWALEPFNDGSLKVSCSHDVSTYGSTCTWAQ